MAKKKPIAETAEPAPEPVPAEPGRTGYTVLARRYRPQQFADLIGQEAVAQALVNAIQSNRVAHAYLFTGARGVGKTSAARILAKALNCAKGPTPTPCDQCDNCKAIASGEDQDVLEIDGASNRGIDEVREIRQNVQFRPTRSRYKIYIIDEVHMLTTPAFNALLKTLEEPPPHVKFIFATTEAQSIPVTILSRCQRFDFGGISIPRILDRLRGIVASEKMQADEEALGTVARRAGGSMRDAQSLLDQLLSFSGDKLTVDSVHGLLGTAHEERVTALAEAVLAKDTKKALQGLSEIMNQGQQIGELLDQLIDYWRDLMVVNCAGLEGQSVSVTSARRETLQKHARQTNLDTILAGMDILVGVKTRLRFSSHGRTLLEMALVRLGQMEELLSIGQIAQLLSKEGPPKSASPAARASVSAPAHADANFEKKKLTADTPAVSANSILPLQPGNLPAIWQQIVENSGFAMQAELRKVTAHAISGPNALALRVSRRYNTQSTGFADPALIVKLEESLSCIVGQSAKVRVEWVDEAQSPSAAPENKSPAAAAMGQQRQLRAELMQIPLVKQMTDVLGAQVVRADDGFGAASKTPVADSDTITEDE